MFKTIKIEGNGPFDVTIETDIQSSGYIEKEWFEEKEGSWYAFIRNSGTTPAGQEEFSLRKVGGLGKSLLYSGVLGAREMTFPMATDLSAEMSIGDSIYFSGPPYTDPIFAGTLTGVTIDKPASTNKITFNDNVSGAQPVGVATPFVFFSKNSVAESQGVLGHYAKVKLSKTDNTYMSEVFSVEPEVMISYT